MGTVSSFQRSLASPYLWQEAAAPALVAGDLERAQKCLDEMPGKKDAADQMLMAYQSIYKSAEALLHARGYKAANFRCLLIALEELYVVPGKLADGDLESFVKAQELVGTFDDTAAAAQHWLAQAHALTGRK